MPDSEFTISNIEQFKRNIAGSDRFSLLGTDIYYRGDPSANSLAHCGEGRLQIDLSTKHGRNILKELVAETGVEFADTKIEPVLGDKEESSFGDFIKNSEVYALIGATLCKKDTGKPICEYEDGRFILKD